MDQICALLDGPRARDAFVIRCLLQPPWSMHICDEAPLTIVAVVRGEAWITQAGVCSRVPTGSVALVVGPEPYEMSSSPGLPHDVVIMPGQHCVTLDGESLEMSMRLGVRSWGHSLDAETVLVTGTYEHHSALAVDVLAGLATPVVVARPEPDPLVDLLGHELTHDAPGQQTVLDRLLDALTVDTLRTWYVGQGCDAPAWWLGHQDTIVGEALRLIHDRPEHDWTIGSLARSVGTSRANLARRFSSLVGEPVGAYLTKWRMALAADLLAKPGSTVTQVAAQVGYATPFGFSSAFKRRYGISPTAHRRAGLAAERSLVQGPTIDRVDHTAAAVNAAEV